MKTIFDNPWMRYLAITFLSFSLLMVTGCGGCRSDADKDELAKKEELEKKKKKRKPDFDTNTPVLLPGVFPNLEQNKDAEADKSDPLKAAFNEVIDPVIRRNRVKLGHWYTANFQAIANNYNADGQLTAFSMDGLGKPVPIPATDYFFSTSRPVSLPKGEWKNFETSVFIPPRNKKVSSATVNYNMSRGAGGLSQISLGQPTMLMKPYQYHIVLLSDRPDNYGYLKLADCIQLRGQTADGGMVDPFYFIVPSEPGKPLPLPRHSLNWTTIAYLVWDDYDPNSLEQEHKDAILDWIHYGGQLIISGPDSLDRLQSSFLADYLPAHFDGARNLTNQDLEELNKNWTVPSTKNQAESRTFQVSAEVPLLGVTFKPHKDAAFVDGTGEIAIERRVGRGRIVATAFSLSAPAVRQWRSFRSFLNSALLRRPARNFGKTRQSDVLFEWVGDGTNLFDPMINSTLRYLSRDLSRQGTLAQPQSKFVSEVSEMSNSFRPYIDTDDLTDDGLSLNQTLHKTRKRNLADDWHYGGYQDTEQSGTGGWNDRSGVSFAARESLVEAAGITPPSSAFVLKMLAAYLVVLVPVNWFLFRMIGRVEYAWVAAPVIAIVGAVLVVKMAALDIGFVRSNSQIGILEVHADYPRAHLTEYSALYTSLSTGYNADLDNVSAQSLPFATIDQPANYVPKESYSEVQLRRTVKNRLEGFQIQSNSTGLLHTEYMLDLTGIFSFVPPADGEARVSNSTQIDLTDAAVLGRDSDGAIQMAWIGDLPSGNDAELKFDSRDANDLGAAWIGNPTFKNTYRSAGDIWDSNLGEAQAAVLDEIREFPELKSAWPKYERLFLQNSSDPENAFNRQTFVDIYQVVNSAANVSLGRMLDVVLNNLTLAPGEYRLIGATRQRLGKTVFDPESTQTDQQTLVVAHLKQPKFPVPQPDLNSYEDFTGKTSLDWEQEMKELDDETGQ